MLAVYVLVVAIGVPVLWGLLLWMVLSEESSMSTSTDLAHQILIRFAPPAAPDGETLGQLLQRSIAAHLRYRRAADDRRADLDAVAEAATTRAQAELRDPNHRDPAWHDNGTTHADAMATHLDMQEDLLRFYVQELIEKQVSR